MYTWSLNDLYPDYGITYEKDVAKLETLIQENQKIAASLSTLEDFESYIENQQKLNDLIVRLYSFVHLQITTDSNDKASTNQAQRLQGMFADLSIPEAQFKTWLSLHKDDFPTWIENSTLVKEHAFIFTEMLNQEHYNLSEDVENALSRMKLNASSNWSKLQGHLTSNTTIMFDGKEHTMSSLRALAYDHDQEVRKKAYEKELELYKKIEDSVAFSLNSIKGQVLEENALRGYRSPIEKTLMDSRMSQATLDALIGAIEKYLPTFQKYFNHKAKILGHTNGLPWYDLFAPFESENPKSYSIEDSKEMILESFGSFSEDLKTMAQHAYEDRWIDFLPREGKRSGAFCSNLAPIKQSRILSNFDGSISDVITLAHELGHAYHGMLIEDLSPLNTDYTMPVAETASTFCENIVLNYALKDASDDESIVLLEQSISDAAQITVDILSRYKFESQVFESRVGDFLYSDTLQEFMLKAQDETYGAGLDPNYKHPYMWVCKGHYYSAGLNFYNFPYAFGGLFALGLYSKYEREGESFVPQYRALLTATTTASCEDVAALAGIDVTSQTFWESSLDIIAQRIQKFIELTPVQ